MGIEVSGILGLMLLVINVWIIVRIVQSTAGTARKVIWIVAILLLPLVGAIAWFFLGPKG